MAEEAPRCQIHKGEVKRLYCKTCDELICQDCTVVDHSKPQHHYVDSDKASLECRQALRDFIPVLSKCISELEQPLAATSQAKQEFANKIEQTKKEVKDRAARIREDVTIQENKMLHKLERLHHDRMLKYDDHHNKVTMMLQRRQHLLETVRDVTNTASDSNLLSYYPQVSRDFKLVRNQTLPKIDPYLSHLRFRSSWKTGNINLGKIQIPVGASAPARRAEGTWKLLHEFGKHGKHWGEFEWAVGVAVPKPDEIAVADYNNSRVQIFSADGHHKRDINVEQHTNNVAAIHELLVVVDNSEYVKVFDKDGEFAFKFPTVPQNEADTTEVGLESVAVKKDGTIVVGDVARMVLTEHRPTDGALIRTIPVPTRPFFLALDNCNDRIVISGEGQEADVVDRNGTSLFTIRPTIDGQPVRYFRSACCDSSGFYTAVVESSFKTGHIHHYDSAGGFLGCLAQDLHYPCGITLTADGKLVVADYYSVKIYHKV